MKVVLITNGPAPQWFPAADCIVVPDVPEPDACPDADLFADCDFGPDAPRVAALARLLPAPVIVNAVVPTIAGIGRPFVRLNGWPGFAGKAVHELVVPDGATAAALTPLYGRMGMSFRLAPDVPGMITARIVASIINEAWFTWEAGVSSKEDIDTAMKLGTNYPMGPFEWGNLIGPARVLQLLEAMSAEDERYMPAESLKNAVEGIKI
ncbi:MAG TPA: 3-hydroxyacyl-CoA dehydrogenase family protein [Puia sp.]|nr:3-hydroxyacyl-CoA dehydrogenase family protein [Puia sp.]